MQTLFTLDLTCNKEHALKLVETTLNISESFIFGRSSKLGVQISTEDLLLLILTQYEELFPNIPFALKERT